MIETKNEVALVGICPCGAGYEAPWIPDLCGTCGRGLEDFRYEVVEDGQCTANWMQDSLFA